MLLKIAHRTRYAYDHPVGYALQRLRVVPVASPTQTVVDWSVELKGASEQVRYTDHHGNDTRLIAIEGGQTEIVVDAKGSVETLDTAGVLGMQYGYAPLWLFLRQTPLTMAGPGTLALAGDAGGAQMLDRLHALMALIEERVAYAPGSTTVVTTAEQALELGQGVCQDHAHLFLGAARSLGVPARYVSGYLLLDGTGDQVAMHAWAEAHVEGLGWVGFDPANGISPDGRYVRVATGLDYRDAMPISGIRSGQSHEELAVNITVEQ
jgi:transglutaminase-like putative cysteine protease